MAPLRPAVSPAQGPGSAQSAPHSWARGVQGGRRPRPMRRAVSPGTQGALAEPPGTEVPCWPPRRVPALVPRGPVRPKHHAPREEAVAGAERGAWLCVPGPCRRASLSRLAG